MKRSSIRIVHARGVVPSQVGPTQEEERHSFNLKR